jgi:5'-nucleotidase
MIILVDMDGVICDFIGGWLKKVKEELDLDLPYPLEWQLELAFPQVETKLITDVFRKPGFFLGLDPMPGAIDALNMMVEAGNEVYICTSPQLTYHCAAEKTEWVDSYLGRDWVARTIISKDKTLIHGDILIDDEPIKEGLFKPTWEHVIYEHPFHAKEKREGRAMITWKNWPKIYEYVK